MDTIHDTLRFTRDLARPVADVWAAYADVTQRVRWSVPDGEAMEYERSEFSVGGLDVYRCGPPKEMTFVGHVRYFTVNEPNLIVYSEAVQREGELLSVTLVTWHLEADVDKTSLSVVNQATSLVGCGMIDGHRNGHEKALDQLERWLA